MNNVTKIILISICVPVILFFGCKQPNESNMAINVGSTIEKIVKDNNFNGNILVSNKGEIIYKECFGYSNFSAFQNLNDSSIFLLCSVSKQFTAMGIMILKERGLLSYDDDLRKYIPEIPYEGITIRNMLNHTSGLPAYETLLLNKIGPNKIASNKDIIEMLISLKPPVMFKPGEKWEYCDTAYELLASIIEIVSNKSYGEFLKLNIFDPLQMENSFNYITRRSKSEVVPNYAFGYLYSDSLKKYVLPDSLVEHNIVFTLDATQGAGSINSTVVDMHKWDRALYTEKIVKFSTLKEAFQPTKLQNDSIVNYGFGWYIEIDPLGRRTVSHTGGWPGYRTYISRSLDADNCIIVLSNNESNSFIVGRTIYDELFK